MLDHCIAMGANSKPVMFFMTSKLQETPTAGSVVLKLY